MVRMHTPAPKHASARLLMTSAVARDLQAYNGGACGVLHVELVLRASCAHVAPLVHTWHPAPQASRNVCPAAQPTAAAATTGADISPCCPGPDLDWIVDSAEKLPLPDASCDSYTIAFGIRNVTNRDAALREAVRVLKSGGRFMCLEFSQVETPVLKELYDAYSVNVIPNIGKIIADDGDSYQCAPQAATQGLLAVHEALLH